MHETTTLETVQIRVHYDLASTLCYVARCCMERIAPDLEAGGVELEWSPIDLSMLTRWPRDTEPSSTRRAHVLRVADDLRVSVRVPRLWHDSRRAHAIGLAADEIRQPTWRERSMNAVYEEGRPLDRETLSQRVPELCFTTDPASLEALDYGVTGVPSFMLSRWPFGEIQSDETMRTVLTRFAARQREGQCNDSTEGEQR